MALQSFTWNNGTNENPVPLNAQQLSNLVRLATTENISKDVRGHITTTSGTISRYDKYVLNQAFPNLTVHATEQSDSFALAASRTTINEGETSTIIVTGMATSSVDFAIEHTVTGRNGIEENAVKSKMHMDGNILVVDAPQENASWQDVVRVKAKPIYEDWSNSSAIRYIDITVKAIALSGVTLIGNSTIPVGNTEEISVNLAPSNCTKSSGVSFSNTLVSDGSLPIIQPLVSNGKIYVTAPAEECGLTLTTNVHLFGDENTIAFYATKQLSVLYPYIQITITTDGTFGDIQSANPKVTLKRTVRPDGATVSVADQELSENKYVLSGSVSGDSLVYTLGEGRVAGNGTEEFVSSFDEIGEQYKVIQNITIKPTNVITEISKVYEFKRPDLYFVYGDGDYEPLSAIETRGSFKSGKTRIGIAIVTEDTSFILSTAAAHKPEFNNGTTKFISSSTEVIDSGFISESRIEASEDFGGQNNTIAIYNAWESIRANDDTIVGKFFEVAERTVQINNITYHGFVPSLGQLVSIIQNGVVIDSFIETYIGISKFLDAKPPYNRYHMSSSKYNKTSYWIYNPNKNIANPFGNRNQSSNDALCETCFPFNL